MPWFRVGRLSLGQAVGSAIIGVASGIYIFKPYFEALRAQQDILSHSQESSETKNRKSDDTTQK